MSGLTPEERERIYLEEKARIEARERIEQKRQARKSNVYPPPVHPPSFTPNQPYAVVPLRSGKSCWVVLLTIFVPPLGLFFMLLNRRAYGNVARLLSVFWAFVWFCSLVNSDKHGNTRGAFRTEEQENAHPALTPILQQKQSQAEASRENLATPQKSATANQQVESQENVQETNIRGVGVRQVGVVDDVAYTVLKTTIMLSIGNEFTETQAGGKFVLVSLLAINEAKETHTITSSMITLLDAQGREYQTSAEGTTAASMNGIQGADLIFSELQPGLQKTLTLVYDVPQNDRVFKLKIPAGTFSLGMSATIKVY